MIIHSPFLSLSLRNTHSTSRRITYRASHGYYSIHLILERMLGAQWVMSAFVEVMTPGHEESGPIGTNAP